MATSYQVEFILENWMIKGLKSKKYYIKSGNLMATRGKRVVKWLDTTNIDLIGEPKDAIARAMNLAGSAASVSFVTSAVNLAIGVAIYHRLGTIESRIEQSIEQIQELFHRVNDIHEEQIRGSSLYPILTGFELFERARISSTRKYLLKAARIEFARGMTSAKYWLQTKSLDELLEHLDWIEDISTALVKAAIIESQIIRMLEISPTKAEIEYPLNDALGTITHLEKTLDIFPTSSSEIHNYERLGDLQKIIEALKSAAEESKRLQLALAGIETNMIDLDAVHDNKTKVIVHAPTRQEPAI